MVWLELIGGFLVFLLFLALADRIDRRSEERFGYRPFALPNLAFMLIPHGVLVLRLLGPHEVVGISLPVVLTWGLTLLGAAALSLMLLILYRRTDPPVALVAAGMMLMGAPILLLSMLFRDLAGSAPGA